MSENTIPPNDQPDIDQELELARAAFHSGDEASAAAWLERLAEQGSAPAMTWAGYVYLYGKGVAVEKALALKWFSKAAEAGDAEAMSWIGHIYASGDGVPADMAMAHQWYLKAAEGGDAYGMSRVAHLYCSGEGVAVDMAAARQWYLKAAEAGDAYGQHCLASMLDKDGEPEEAERWLQKAAEQGYEPSLRSVREQRAYEMFKEKRYGEALPILSEAARAGSAWAHEMLGIMCWNACGVSEDREQSLRHYQSAYDGGRTSLAPSIVAMHLKLGHPEAALEWASKGAVPPISSLYWQYRVLREHPHLQRHARESVEFLRKAADAGHMFAKRDIAVGMIKGSEGLGGRFLGALAWAGFFPNVVRIAAKDLEDERLR
jgi:TPR repeat protein